MGEALQETSDNEISVETLNTFKRLGVVGVDGVSSDQLKEFMNPANRSTANEQELLRDFLEAGDEF